MKKIALISGISAAAISAGAAGLCLGLIKTPVYIHTSHIMNIGDVYGEMPGYGDDYFDVDPTNAGAIRTADAMQRIVANNPGSFIVNNGDAAAAGVFSVPSKGSTTYNVLKAMDVRYSAIGNHEWDWGKQKIQSEFEEIAKTPNTDGHYFLSANILTSNYQQDIENWNKLTDSKGWVYDPQKEDYSEHYNIWKTKKVSWADPYKVVDMAGHKVCLIGLTTKETRYDSQLQETKDCAFIDYIASVNYAKQYFKETQPEEYNKVESFILLTHVGATLDDSRIVGDVGEIAEQIDTDVDVIIGGHEKIDINGKVYNNKLKKPISVIQSTEKLSEFSDIALTFDDSRVEGDRLIGIECKKIKPEIDSSSKEAAAKQLNDIAQKPFNGVVKNTVDVYVQQKQNAKSELAQKISHSNLGLKYSQLKDLDAYIVPETTVDPAGAFLAKMFIESFGWKYSTAITKKLAGKPNIAIIGNDSVRQEIPANYDVTKKDIFGLFPYTNYFVQGTLTYDQLEQVIRYMLSGEGWTKLERSVHFYTDPVSVRSGEKEIILQLRTPHGPAQFYGFSFKKRLIAEGPDAQGRKYEYVNDSLKVYAPDESDCFLDSPDTWKAKDYFTGLNPHSINFVMNSFNYGGGNNQFKLIKKFAEYNLTNYTNSSFIFSQTTDDVRDVFIDYVNNRTKQDPGFYFDFNQNVLEQLVVEDK